MAEPAVAERFRAAANLSRRVRNFRRLTFREKAWLILLFPLSGCFRAMVLLFPFPAVSSCLGTRRGNLVLCPLADPEQLRMAARIGQLVETVCRRTPWQSRCLVQAFLAKTLLSHHRIPYVLHLGVARKRREALGDGGADSESGAKEKTLSAHAWVAVGPRVVTGRQGHKNYAVVATFTSPDLGASL